MRAAIAQFLDDLREEESYNEEAEEWQFRDGNACAICTHSAMQVVKRFGGVVLGYYSFDNPAAYIGEPYDGHDFALIKDRWLVDYWAWRVTRLVATPIFDLSNDADQKEVFRLYGPPVKWEALE